MYNGKSVVIDGKFNNYNNNSYNSGNRNDAALNRRRRRTCRKRCTFTSKRKGNYNKY